MNTTIKCLFVFMFLTPIIAFSQSSLKGTVSEQESGLPLPGVNVLIKGTTNGTTTDFDGNYQISAQNGDVIVFSYVGFTTQEISFNNQSELNIVMIEDASALDEVVLIGYGSVKKEDLTGAADLITTEDFNQGPLVSAQQLITGKIAGVSVTSGSGAPGEGQVIRIRGNGSLSLSSNPLFVVDGIPLNDGGVGGTRNPLNLINPNDIESMVVLKDASATAIYGSRGANGVIMVTTKSGKSGDFKLNFNASTTSHTALDKVHVLNASQFTDLVNLTENTDAISRLGDSNTDWQDEIYDTAMGQDYSLSLTGQIIEMPVRLSLGLSDHDGILLGDNFERKTASINFKPTAFNGDLKMSFNTLYSLTSNTFANRGAIGNAISYDPTQGVYDETSPYGGFHSWIDPVTGSQYNLAPTNPVALLNLTDDNTKVSRIVSSANFDYNFPFMDALTASMKIGIDQSNGSGSNITSAFMPTSDPTFNGAESRFKNEATNTLFDFYLTYKKSFSEMHNLTAVAGYSYQSFEFDNYSYDSEAEEDGNDFEFIDTSKNVLLSYFGRLNYDYDGKYLLTATLRADASSKLNPDDRWGYFPSLAAAWNIHNEDFMSGDFFNELKLRVGYGEVGNVNGLGDYRFLTRYTGSTSTANYQFGNSFYQTYRPEPLNEELRWEIGRTTNFGLDFAFLNNRVSGSINAYVRETKDLIAFSSVDPFTNFGNRVDKNIGDMENKGLEIMLNTTPVSNDLLEWSVGYNVAFNDNTITYLPFDQPTGGISGGVGNNVQLQTQGQTPYSFYVFEQVYDSTGAPIEGVYVDRNGDDIINDDDKFFFKSPFADITMGFNTNLNYKNWDFALVARVSLGNYAYDNVASSTGYERRATDNSILTNLHSDYLTTGFENITENNLLSSHYVREASFLKIDNITLGYTISGANSDVNCRLYGSLQNVLTVTDYEGLDPEIFGGIDNNFYPRPQSFVFGVNIDF
ncbi:MAG: SusC/RagA family TonB-linked outer membrane protein [Flavobacteriaceae bacterium]|nr:SusC/RagA family TonB-linked outer membrane protein [Flavobacteriaceae bacterium]